MKILILGMLILSSMNVVALGEIGEKRGRDPLVEKTLTPKKRKISAIKAFLSIQKKYYQEEESENSEELFKRARKLLANNKKRIFIEIGKMQEAEIHRSTVFITALIEDLFTKNLEASKDAEEFSNQLVIFFHSLPEFLVQEKNLAHDFRVAQFLKLRAQYERAQSGLLNSQNQTQIITFEEKVNAAIMSLLQGYSNKCLQKELGITNFMKPFMDIEFTKKPTKIED